VKGPVSYTEDFRPNFSTDTFSVTPNYDPCTGSQATISFSGEVTKPVAGIAISVITDTSVSLGAVLYPSGTTSVSYSKVWTATPYTGLGYEINIKFEDQTTQTIDYPFFNSSS
jgi:hypothetical protein